MPLANRRRALALAFLLAASPLLAQAQAQQLQSWPAKPIVMVVPQGPGSGSDVIARLLAKYMAPALGQSVVVENRTGAGGIVAHQYVKRAAPDGYTVLLTSTAQLLVVPAINPAANYSLDDFVPVAPVLRAPFALLVANTASAPKSVKELIERLRATPSAFASAGQGTMTHLGSEIFLQRAGVKATHIPYKGSGAALADLMGGQVLFATDSLTAASNLVRSGQLRALAVTGARREASLPDVPTLAEAGLPGDPVAVIGGLFAPKGLPPEIAARLGKAVDEALRNPELVERFASIETDVLRESNAEFLGQLRKEAPGWTALVKQLDLKTE